MSELLKGFCTVLIRDPLHSQIEASWYRITHEDFERVQVVWWCIGEHEAANYSLWRDTTHFLIAAKPGKTYIVAARAVFAGDALAGITESYWTKWAYTVIEVPQAEQPRHTCRLEVIDTPRGPAVLLEDLCEQGYEVS